ncbi:hypothetical protein BDQ17DRAFT_1435806 [Cyathus striatus]|nr:hypothetical protein BDQ17DRAFT_1435806 [Cyathus striatus]
MNDDVEVSLNLNLPPALITYITINTEGSTDGSNAGHGNESEHSDEDHTSKNKGSDISIISSKSNSNHIEDRTSKDKELDIIMNSPPVSPPHTTSKPDTVNTVDIINISPKGASRSEGSILRGNALGNHPNATNFHSAAESTTVGSVKGQVWLYMSNADPSTVMSGFQPNTPLSLNIETYSVQSKSAGSSAASSRAVSRSHTPSLIQRGGISEQCTEELVEVLKIPRDILESTAPGLRVAYQRYLACIKAVSDHNIMDKNRTWPIAKATKKEIVTVFVSSSAWYENYSNFDKIADFPTMQSWLVEDEDSPSDLDLWGFESDHYTFLDLKKWLKEKKEKRKGKGKGNSKEEKGGRDEKSHEEKEKSSLKKHK